MKLSTKLARLVAKLQATLKTEGGVGFTMIELLIVIAILGILAIAVLAAINPVEQINRGRDTGFQSDAEQFLSAADRFNAFQGYYPWQIGANDVGGLGVVQTPVLISNPDDFNDSSGCHVLDKLGSQVVDGCTNTNELLVAYVQKVRNPGYRGLWIYNRGTAGDSTYVCFWPMSSAFKQTATDRCNAGLPEDLTDIASSICAGTPGTYESDLNLQGQNEPMICLP